MSRSENEPQVVYQNDSEKPRTQLKRLLLKKVCPPIPLLMKFIKLGWKSEKILDAPLTYQLLEIMPSETLATDLALYLTVFHFEFLFGNIPSSLKHSLKKTYWLFFDKIEGIKKRYPICNDNCSEVVKFMIAESSRNQMFSESSTNLLCTCFNLLYGEFMINRISLLAHDEEWLHSNWALKGSQLPSFETLEILVEIVKRQLRVCDLLLHTLSAVLIMLTCFKKRDFVSCVNMESVKMVCLACYVLQTDMDNLLFSICHRISYSISFLSFDTSDQDKTMWKQWLLFNKPLSLIQNRLQLYNDHLSTFLPLGCFNGNISIKLLNPVPKFLLETLTSINIKPLEQQMNVLQSLNAVDAKACAKKLLNYSLSVKPPLQSFKSLDNNLKLNSSTQPTTSNSMVTAFDLDFTDFLKQSKTSHSLELLTSYDSEKSRKKINESSHENLEKLVAQQSADQELLLPSPKNLTRITSGNKLGISEPVPEDYINPIDYYHDNGAKCMHLYKDDQTNAKLSSDWEISYHDLKIMDQIGSGATSTVYKGLWNGTEVAVKKMTSSLVDPSEMQKFKREIQILFKLRHPNLTLIMGASVQKEPYFTVMEYCEGGDLFSLLHTPHTTAHTIQNLSLHQMLKIAKDIAKGMAYLHNLSPQVIHRDLKSLNIILSNILKSPYDEPLAKISDFGLSQLREVNNANLYHTRSLVGTCHWMAPEMFMSLPYDETIDVYSFGILLYEIFTQTIPFSTQNPVNIAVAVSQGLRPDLSHIFPETPELIIILIKACWSQNPALRPSFATILKNLESIEI